MFTGLITEVGKLNRKNRTGDIICLDIHAPEIRINGLKTGDSVAVNGICLTATVLSDKGFTAQAMRETSGRTTLAGWQLGDELNLERPLTLNSFLDGHLVTGHIDGLARITEIIPEGQANRIFFQPPADVTRYIACKGSVALDGVSLTVASVEDDGRFSVGVIPHTLAHTALRRWRPGIQVNLEVDLIARYLERLQTGVQNRGLTLERLLENGF